MKNIMSKNILRLRKEKGYTQKKLADLMQVSAQAISKWETGQSYPDIELLPRLTDVLETNIDTLLAEVSTLIQWKSPKPLKYKGFGLLCV